MWFNLSSLENKTPCHWDQPKCKVLHWSLESKSQSTNERSDSFRCLFVYVCVGVCGQSCPTVCSPMDCSPPGSSVHGIFQARILRGCHFLLQGLFPTQRSNPGLLCLLHWQTDFLPLYPLGSPYIYIYVTYIFLIYIIYLSGTLWRTRD